MCKSKMLGGLLVVALLWGVTTPLMRLESVQEAKQQAAHSAASAQQWPLLVRLLCQWKFLVIYLLNQVGSLAYYSLLGTYELMVVSPLANGLAFFFTFLTESLLERRMPRRAELLGASFVVLGFAVCLRGGRVEA